MARARDRDEAVRRLLSGAFDEAPRQKRRLVDNDLELIFNSHDWGHREILLVTALARLVDREYQASRDFYACHPRALFEGPIRAVLTEHGVPHRKSGPLNIAKNAERINEQWAARRGDIGAATVRVVERLDHADQRDLQMLLVDLASRFLGLAEVARQSAVARDPEADIGMLIDLLIYLVEEAPDAGNTAQRIVGYALQAYHEAFRTSVLVRGHEDSASTTSTTAGKAGDIREESADGTILRVYEVTTKKFDESRTRDARAAVRSYEEKSGTSLSEVVVVCRTEDVHGSIDLEESSTHAYLGEVEHEGVSFQFAEITEWITAKLIDLPPAGRLRLFELLKVYANDPNTNAAVREAWAKF